MPETKQFYFCDWNMPGVVYYGDQRAFDWLSWNGCAPQLWSDKQQTAPVGQSVDVKIRIEGKSVIEKWPVQLCEAAEPGQEPKFDTWLLGLR